MVLIKWKMIILITFSNFRNDFFVRNEMIRFSPDFIINK